MLTVLTIAALFFYVHRTRQRRNPYHLWDHDDGGYYAREGIAKWTGAAGANTAVSGPAHQAFLTKSPQHTRGPMWR